MQNKFLYNSFNFVKNTVWKCTHKDAAKMLIGMGAFGFFLSSLAQCWAIETNDRVNQKKKNFMLAQEAADGAVNIGLFLLVTSGVWKLSDKLLAYSGLGQFSKNKPVNFVIKPNGKSHIKSGARIFTTMIASVLACNVITPLIRNVIAGKFRAYSDKKDQYNDTLLMCLKKSKGSEPFNKFNELNYSNIKSYAITPCYTSKGSMRI